MSIPPLFKWRHFQAEIILLNVRWYCRYALSYRDLQEMMQERGVEVDHSTINRWVLKGCVAKTSVSLEMIVFILTVARPTCLVHEPKAPFQVASFPIGHHPDVCQVVLALPPQLPQP